MAANRLIGDSSISNANQLSRIWEKVELPSLADVAQFVSRHQGTAWHAFSLDIAKAHKRIRVCTQKEVCLYSQL